MESRKAGTGCGGLRRALIVLCALGAGGAHSATFVVNSLDDLHDASPGDAICETLTGGGVCTLRAAVEEANALAGADVIKLGSGTYHLTQYVTLDSAPAELVISDDVSIEGTGQPNTFIDGNNLGQRVFYLPELIGGAEGTTELVVSMAWLSIVNGNGPVDDNVDHGRGAGVANHAHLTLDHVTVSGNSVHGVGGGLYNTDTGSLHLTNSFVSSNTALAGGGIANMGAMSIDKSTIDDNSLYTIYGTGAGIYLDVTAATEIRNSTISHNKTSTSGDGGGIYNKGALLLVDDTISGNFANNGGGIYNDGGNCSIYNATVSANYANEPYPFNSNGHGGGIGNSVAGTVTLTNSIVAGNFAVIFGMIYSTTVGDECVGIITSLGYSIVQAVDAAHCTVNGSYSTADPLLWPLEHVGGLTKTHAITPGSAALDAGNPSGCKVDNTQITSDQRGYTRPYGAACDIGAFEYTELIFADGNEI